MIVDVESGEVKTLVHSETYRNWFPSWSPDGSLIAFASDRDQPDGDTHIYTVNIDGTHPVRLTDFDSDIPDWSPDGTRIAFETDRDGNLEIYAMDSDGTNLVRLTNDPADDYEPIWSPDGNFIVFSSDRGGAYRLYIMDAEGGNVEALPTSANASAPMWSH